MFQGVRRDLADVAPAAMDTLQKRHQGLAKNLIVLRAAAPSRRLELHVLYAARGACQSRQLISLSADVLADHRLQDRRQVQLLLFEQLQFLGAVLAEVLLLLLAVDDLGKMHRRGLIAGWRLTFHERVLTPLAACALAFARRLASAKPQAARRHPATCY